MPDMLHLTVEVDTKKGEARLKGFDRQVDRTTGKTKTSAKTMGGMEMAITKLAAAAGGLIVFDRVAGWISSAVNEAVKFELETKRLAIAVSQAGGSASTTQAMLDFADSMKRASLATEEQIIKAQSLAVAMGGTTETAQQAALAAANLAAARANVDFDTAIRQLTRTLGGYAGELTEIVPEVKGLTRAQLQSGEAIEIVLELYRGFDAQLRDTTAGSIKGFTDAIDDLKKAFGGGGTGTGLAGAMRVFLDNVLTPVVDKLTETVNLWNTLYGTPFAILMGATPTAPPDTGPGGAPPVAQPAPYGFGVDTIMNAGEQYKQIEGILRRVEEAYDDGTISSSQYMLAITKLVEEQNKLGEILGIMPEKVAATDDAFAMMTPGIEFAVEQFDHLQDVASAAANAILAFAQTGEFSLKRFANAVAAQAAATLTSMAIVEVVRGMRDVAEGMSMLANPFTAWMAPAYFAAAKAHYAVAAKAGAGAAIALVVAAATSGGGGGGGGGGAAGGGGTTSTIDAGRDVRNQARPQEVHIHVENLVGGPEEAARIIQEELDRLGARTGRT